MKTLPASPYPRRVDQPSRRGQSLVEFALMLPVLLLLIFVIVEVARLLHAWVAIENGARFGVRYAVTGEFDSAFCQDLDGDLVACNDLGEMEVARLPSIEDAAMSGSVAILRETSFDDELDEGRAGFFRVTICSSRSDENDVPLFAYHDPVPALNQSADCTPNEDAGGPGDSVSVTVDFDHPLIVPFLSNLWPQIHLTSTRQGIVEQFRTARIRGLPSPVAVPSATPQPDPPTLPPATDTPPPPTATPTNTSSPTNTPTPTNTFTATPTPTNTATPDCSLLYIQNMWTSNTTNYSELRARVVNQNDATGYLTYTWLNWPDVGNMYVDWFLFVNNTYYSGNDFSPPTSANSNVGLPGHRNNTWRARFRNVPESGVSGTFHLRMTFNFPGWGTCELEESRTQQLIQATPRPTNPPATNTPQIGPSNTPLPTNTPAPGPSNTPWPTNSPQPTNTPGSPTPTRTPTPTNTQPIFG